MLSQQILERLFAGGENVVPPVLCTPPCLGTKLTAAPAKGAPFRVTRPLTTVSPRNSMLICPMHRREPTGATF